MELFLFKKIATLYLDSCRGHFRRMMLLSHAYKFLIWVRSRYYICSVKIATLSNSTRCELAHQQSRRPLGAGTTLPVFDSACSEVVLSPALLVKFPPGAQNAHAMSKGLDLFTHGTKGLGTNYAQRTGQRITTPTRENTKSLTSYTSHEYNFWAWGCHLRGQSPSPKVIKSNMCLCLSVPWNLWPASPPWLAAFAEPSGLTPVLHPCVPLELFQSVSCPPQGWVSERVTHRQVRLLLAEAIFSVETWRTRRIHTHEGTAFEWERERTGPK